MDARLAEMERYSLELSDRLHDRERELQKTLRDLDVAQNTRSRSTFADLGGEFESTLRMAEDQARQIRESAQNEATQTIMSAREDSGRLRDGAMRDAQSLLVESERRVETLQAEAEAINARAELESAELVAKAKAGLSSAERAATAKVLQAEKSASAVLAAATREAQEIKERAEQSVREAFASLAEEQAQMREKEAGFEARRTQVEIWILTSEASQREKDAAAEQRRAQMDEEAQRLLERAHTEADNHVGSAVDRATMLRVDADARVTAADVGARSIINEANLAADTILTTAMSRAQSLAQRTDQLAGDMLREAEMQVAEARHRKSMINDFVDDVREILNADALEATIEDAESRQAETSGARELEAAD